MCSRKFHAFASLLRRPSCFCSSSSTDTDKRHLKESMFYQPMKLRHTLFIETSQRGAVRCRSNCFTNISS
uniref:Uncharacterized protein n=1 Tax=Hyaloperonospora arabidopsidis (strain Emoy2) TaxID=559515 RepID=M4BBU1_HYAAE